MCTIASCITSWFTSSVVNSALSRRRMRSVRAAAFAAMFAATITRGDCSPSRLSTECWIRSAIWCALSRLGSGPSLVGASSFRSLSIRRAS